jgi:hypothetical protein
VKWCAIKRYEKIPLKMEENEPSSVPTLGTGDGENEWD